MAEDTEALKHNFFLRGFFRRRGYYNLTHIPSDSYRKDRVFTNPPTSELGCLRQSSLERITVAQRYFLRKERNA
jgi:hypothetical protein